MAATVPVLVGEVFHERPLRGSTEAVQKARPAAQCQPKRVRWARVKGQQKTETNDVSLGSAQNRSGATGKVGKRKGSEETCMKNIWVHCTENEQSPRYTPKIKAPQTRLSHEALVMALPPGKPRSVRLTVVLRSREAF